MIIQDKSKRFAVDIVRFYKYLTDKKAELVLSRQLLRSGTAIGANIAEAANAQSDKDFLSKISIALKECNEILAGSARRIGSDRAGLLPHALRSVHRVAETADPDSQDNQTKACRDALTFNMHFSPFTFQLSPS